MVEIGKYVEFWEGFCVKGQTGKKKHCAESFPQYCKFSIINTRAGLIFWQVFLAEGNLIKSMGEPLQYWLILSYGFSSFLDLQRSISFPLFCHRVRSSAMRGEQFVWEACQSNSSVAQLMFLHLMFAQLMFPHLIFAQIIVSDLMLLFLRRHQYLHINVSTINSVHN